MAIAVDVIGIAPDLDVYGQLPSASVGDAEYPLNDLDFAPLTFSLLDENAALLLAPHPTEPNTRMFVEREVRIRNHDGTVVLEGPARHFRITPQGFVSCRVYSFAWWLARRLNGRADRVNLLDPNAGFEAGTFANWTVVGTPTIVTSPVYTGTYAADLEAGETITKSFTFDHDYGPGMEPRFTVPVYFPTGSTAPADDIWFTVEASDNPGVLTEHEYNDFSFGRDTWQPVNFGLGRPLAAGTAWTVEITLYGGTGGINFDGIRSAQPESIGADYDGSDPADVGVLVVARFQATAFGKDSVGISSTAHATGETVYVVWQDEDHEPFLRILAQLVERGVCDWWCDYTTRTIHFGQRGEWKEEWYLEPGFNLSLQETVIDGTETANAGVLIGVGQDFTRDEGGAVLETAGPILERLDHARVSDPVREYDTVAFANASRSKIPTEAVTGIVTPPEGAVTWTIAQWGGIEPGDSVTVYEGTAPANMVNPGECRILKLTANFELGTIQPTLSVTA